MTDACNVLMIFPRFNVGSFWNYRATCELAGDRPYSQALAGIMGAAVACRREDSHRNDQGEVGARGEQGTCEACRRSRRRHVQQCAGSHVVR
jgi:hypothetical protein